MRSGLLELIACPFIPVPDGSAAEEGLISEAFKAIAGRSPTMRHINISRRRFEGTQKVQWFSTNDPIWVHVQNAELSVNFSFGGRLRSRDALILLENLVRDEEFTWIRQRGRLWSINFNTFRSFLSKMKIETYPPTGFKPLDGFEWIDQVVSLVPELEHRLGSAARMFGRDRQTENDFDTVLSFRIYREDYLKSMSKKIFLSHKSLDKHIVREYFQTLKVLGFDPWLDEKSMTTGTKLERGIKQGFKDSCAAVFFITPKFKDESYLATEVEYALQEERAKGDRFKIICIVLKNRKGEEGEVPEMLKGYVWCHPKSQLEAIRAIVEALPIELGPSIWREG